MRNQYTPNEIIQKDNVAYIELYNKSNEPIAEAIIDSEDVRKINGRKWCLNDQRYVVSGYGKNRVRLHHIVFDFKFKSTDDLEIDHINDNTLDNRKSNLRICTHRQNIRNKRMNKNNTSGFLGVNKVGKRWRARILNRHKTEHLGYFDNAVDAAMAYDEAASKYFGEFARLNFG